MNRGYFGIGVEHSKTEVNIGTLYRTALAFEASFIYTIGRRYKKQVSDTVKSYRHMPLYHYQTFDEFYKNIPYGCRLIGVENDSSATSIKHFVHPERAVYLLGAEDHGLTHRAREMCHHLVIIPGNQCLNVSVAGSIMLYDRINKLEIKKKIP
jgi:tRNA G18 (ribose-2'-O)-methylase SpoU